MVKWVIPSSLVLLYLDSSFDWLVTWIIDFCDPICLFTGFNRSTVVQIGLKDNHDSWVIHFLFIMLWPLAIDWLNLIFLLKIWSSCVWVHLAIFFYSFLIFVGSELILLFAALFCGEMWTCRWLGFVANSLYVNINRCGYLRIYYMYICFCVMKEWLQCPTHCMVYWYSLFFFSRYLTELLGERQKIGPFMAVLPHCYRLLNQG